MNIKQRHSTAGCSPQFRTVVRTPSPLKKFGVGEKGVFLGSCFAHNIGNMFKQARLNALVCPLGSSYSPASVVRLLMSSHVDDVVLGPVGWHTWLSDTTFAREDKEMCLVDTRLALDNLHKALAEADNLFVTLGTNHAYRLRLTGEVVVNCHKHKQNEFIDEAQSVEQMTEDLDAALCRLRARNEKLTVTFTVSPYRYAKYGFHESNLGKATLLLTADALQRRHPEWIQYFPAYEIVVDELRDYRFYDDDMLHPSPQAIRYIWQRLQEWMDDELLEYLRRWKPLGQALAHRPIHPSEAGWQKFAEYNDGEMERLQRDYPMLRIKS